MKKTLSLIVLVLILAFGVWAYLSKEKPLPVSGSERGVVASITEGTLILEVAEGSPKTYAISSTTTVSKETEVSTDSLPKGSSAYAVSNPETGKLLSLTMLQDKSMLPIVEDQSWFVAGTIEGVSGKTVTIKGADGALRNFITDDQVVLLSNEKTDISSLKDGDRAIVSWSISRDGSPQADSIFLPAL